jgi:hemerythrin-like domain-containing protein
VTFIRLISRDAFYGQLINYVPGMVLTYHKKRTYWPGTFLGNLVQVTRPGPPGKFGEELPSISPTEILSREHAIMERLMIVLESSIARIADGEEIDLFPVNHAAITIKEFGADHHMVDEEQFIFPKLREAGTMDRLVDTLELQHDKGREIIGRIIDLTRAGHIDDLGRLNELASLCMSFVIMYRPHAAWEETVVFPALYDIATENYIDNINLRMHDEERAIMSDPGLRRLMDNLRKIEKEAGTSELERFTPQ